MKTFLDLFNDSRQLTVIRKKNGNGSKDSQRLLDMQTLGCI